MSIQFSSIRPIEKTLSGATIQSHSGHGSIGNEGILRIFLGPEILPAHQQIV